jgi:hypothetical protein
MGNFGGDPFGGDTESWSIAEELQQFSKTLHTLDEKTQHMTKSQLYNLQRRMGTAIREFNAELIRQIDRNGAE